MYRWDKLTWFAKVGGRRYNVSFEHAKRQERLQSIDVRVSAGASFSKAVRRSDRVRSGMREKFLSDEKAATVIL
jgi:hypothetical protein